MTLYKLYKLYKKYKDVLSSMYMPNRKILLIASSWSLLGFKRGMDSYDYSHKKAVKSRESYLYSSKIFYGLIGGIAYINPILCGIIIPKEIYRFEVYIRNLEEDKKTDYYNELF